MQLLVIEVLRVPQVSSPERMADWLKIHFLKRSNNGGDVLMVIYPTSTPGQAYVVFESDKVPGVLKCAHILDVNNQLYPIGVKEADLSEVDMQVETSLQLSMFPNPDSIRKLLKSYDFHTTEDGSSRLQLKGSFLKLKLVRAQLIQLLCHDQHRLRSSPALDNGSSLGYDLELEHPESRLVSKSNSRNVRAMDAAGRQELLVSTPSSPPYEVPGPNRSQRIPQPSGRVETVVEDRNKHDLSHGWSSRADGASSHPSVLSLRQRYRDSASNRGTSHAEDTMHASHETRRRFDPDATSSSSKDGVSSFHVATDTINFIQTQHKDAVQTISKNCGTKIAVEADAEVATVTFSGKNSKKAQVCLLNIIQELSPLLRTQEIHLKNYDPSKRRQILERIKRNRDHQVMITQCDDVIRLVGTSKKSFEIMQVILGNSDELSRGRPMERGSNIKRSTSLPRQYKMTQHSFGTEPESQAVGPVKYNPSWNQEKPDEGSAPPTGRGFERTCSKTMKQRIHQDLVLPSSSPGKKSRKEYLKKKFDSNLLPMKKMEFFTQKQTKN